MRVIHYSDARNRFKDEIDRVVVDHDATLIYRRDGKNAVLLSESTYNSIMETLYLMQTPANAAHLMEAVAQDKQERTLYEQSHSP